MCEWTLAGLGLVIGGIFLWMAVDIGRALLSEKADNDA